MFAFSLAGCGTKTDENAEPAADGTYIPDKNDVVESDTDTDKTVDTAMPVAGEHEDKKSYTYNVAFAGWTDDESIYLKSLNSGMMQISFARHLPIYRFDTAADLDSFKKSFSGILTMNHDFDEAPSFEYITAAYDDGFFSKNSLLLVYVSAGSGSYRFGVSDVYCDVQSLCVYIEQLNNPEVVDCMMSGWFAVVEIDKEEIADCTGFDAQLGKPSE